MSMKFDQPARKIFEKMETVVFPDATSASKQVARDIANIIDAKNRVGQQTVLGLATGSTPLQVYSEWVRLHKEEGLTFKNVITFNLDEYYPILPDAKQSYVKFMDENLFNHIDIKRDN